MNLNDILNSDNSQIFEYDDISKEIEISTNSGNKTIVKGSLQSDLVDFSANAGISAPLCAYSVKLYIETPSDMVISVGAMLSVDGVAYKVSDKREELGVLELSLTRAGRW